MVVYRHSLDNDGHDLFAQKVYTRFIVTLNAHSQ